MQLKRDFIEIFIRRQKDIHGLPTSSWTNPEDHIDRYSKEVVNNLIEKDL